MVLHHLLATCVVHGRYHSSRSAANISQIIQSKKLTTGQCVDNTSIFYTVAYASLDTFKMYPFSNNNMNPQAQAAMNAAMMNFTASMPGRRASTFGNARHMMFGQPTPASIIIRPNDVLCGRGKTSFNHCKLASLSWHRLTSASAH